MGVIKQGILGGFSGKVGNVIGGSWKGISYMRTRAISVKNPRTTKQLTQRAKFLIGMNFLKPMSVYLREGYKGQAHQQTAFNAALSYIMTKAMSGEYPNIKIDFGKVFVTRGSLTQVLNAACNVTNEKIEFTWTDNSGQGDASATDIVMPLIYNESKDEVAFNTNAGVRSDKMASLAIPSNWMGNTLQIYLGMRSADGNTTANSLYLSNTTPTGGGSNNPGDGKDDDPLG